MKHAVLTVLRTMKGVKAPQRKFMVELLSVFCLFCGKATYRNLGRFCEYGERTIRRWGNRRFYFPCFNKELLKSEIGTEREYLGVVDCTFINKAGSHTEGFGNFWNGTRQRNERGIEVSILGILDIEAHTAYGIEARQTIDQESSEITRTDLYAAQIVENKDNLVEFGVRYIVTDGLYALRKFTESIRDEGFHQIGKIRVNADLWWPFYGTCSPAWLISSSEPLFCAPHVPLYVPVLENVSSSTLTNLENRFF